MSEEQSIQVKRIVLDVLKPHEPDLLQFASQLVSSLPGCHLAVMVEEMDNHTETVTLEVSGDSVDTDILKERVKELGATVHSIDEVEVESSPIRAE